MSTMRVRALWTVPNGGPGISTFFVGSAGGFDVAQAQLATDDLRSFFAAIASVFPSTVTISMDSEVDIINEVTGQLGAVHGVTPGASVAGTSGGSVHASGVGCRVRWNTAGIRNGRRVVGTTFIVPISAGGYDTSGTIFPTFVTTISDAAANVMLALDLDLIPLQVWSRPTVAPVASGQLSEVTSRSVPDKVAWLRTRKE